MAPDTYFHAHISLLLPLPLIRFHLRIQKRQHLNNAGRIPPIPHQVHYNTKHAHQVHASLLHTAVRISG